jgi:flagellin
MSLRINHNLAALNAHRNLTATTGALSNSMQRLSSGYRINKGSDDPAGLVISEQFRAQIAGLNRAISNSEGSISMVQTAEGALTEINSLLVSMRELAIHAANEGFNSADQLAADQAEITNAIKTIDRIAANTQFGTKKLLDGTNENIATITTTNNSAATLSNSNLKTGSYSLSALKTADASATLNSSSNGISLANTDGDPSNLADGIHNIDIVQASDVAKKTSSDISILDSWGNGITIAAGAATKATVSATGTFTSAAGADNGDYTFILNVQENGATPIGNQALNIHIATADTSAIVKGKIEAEIAANSELATKINVIEDIGAANVTFGFEYADEGAQFSLRVEASSTDATGSFEFTEDSNRGTSIGVLNFTANTAGGLVTNDVTIDDGIYTTMAQLVIEINSEIGDNFHATDDFSAAVYSTNQLQFSSEDEGSMYYLKHNASAGNTEDLSNVLGLSVDAANNTGVDAIVNFDGFANTINAIEKGATGTATLETAAYGDANRGTIEIVTALAASATGSGIGGIDNGNLLLDVTGTKFDVQLNGATAVSATAGIDATIYNGDRTEWITVNYGLTSDGGNETISNTNQALVFQIGGNVGQTADISMRNMSGSSLGKDLIGNMFANLSAIDVQSSQGAQDAQEVIDAAINEVTTTRGALGSFQKNTLESNLRNLRIASQNLTASESQLRDTDMAAEMSEFTKNQILLQAGVSMLAQANQVPQVVLSLFG